jgi:hypothetical protein
LYWNDFIRLAQEVGFPNPRLAKDERIEIHNERILGVLGPAEFFSATYRLFKVEGLEPDAENYGQVGRISRRIL